MSAATSLPTTPFSSPPPNVQYLMSEAERDIRRCYRQFGERPVAELDQACKEIGKRIAAIEASLATIDCDEDTRESFHFLSADLQCLSTRVCIAARQSSRQKEKDLAIQRFIQTIGKIEYTQIKKNSFVGSNTFGVFATSNEVGQTQVLHNLRKAKKFPGGGHLGISGLYNWDIIAQMKSEFAVLIDFNPKVAVFNRNMLAILAEASSPKDFERRALIQMDKDLEADGGFYAFNVRYDDMHVKYHGRNFSDLPKIEQLKYQLKRMRHREHGALSKENFPFLQKMAREGRIVPLHLDFCDTKAIQTIASAVHEGGHFFSSIYLSNIYDYLQSTTSNQTFKQNLAALSRPCTCVVDTCLIGDLDDSIHSFVFWYQDPKTGLPYNPDLLRDRKKNAVD